MVVERQAGEGGGGAGDANSARRWPRSLVVVTLLVGLTRLYALSKTLWDWDETLFCLALRDYDVAAHHPHPPGFPLYVALGRIARLFIPDDFGALQAVVLLSAFCVFPAIYFLARSLRFRYTTAVIAGLVFAFLPNIWFYGGTAFSDVPAVVAVIVAAALLFRGAEDRRLYLLGCAVLAASILFRPQNVLMGAWPWLYASWFRLRDRKRDVVAGAAIATVIVVIGYGAAAWATGFADYLDVVREHRDYVVAVDSYHNPHRPPVLELFRDFAVTPYHAGRISAVLFALVLLGAFRRRSLHLLATFGPFFVFAWFMLDALGVSRLSIGYMPLIALLAATGIETIATVVSLGRSAWLPAAELVMTIVLVGKYALWTIPALREAQTESPPVASARWIREHARPGDSTIYVHLSMEPFAEYFLRGYRQKEVGDDFTRTRLGDVRNAWLWTEGLTAGDNMAFRRPRNRLWRLVRQRYFEVTVRRLQRELRFGDGWYDEEADADNSWRWMGRSSLTELPSGSGTLHIRFYVPLDALKTPATVTLSVNGQVVDRLVCTKPETEKDYAIGGTTGAPNVLRIETSDAIRNGGDPRDLGVQLRAISWKAAP